MKGFQMVSKSAVCFLIEADNCSIDMYSISKFFQSVILIVSFDFQFMRIVFLAMVSAMESILLDVLIMLMLDMSPSKQSVGDSGMWQPKRIEVIGGILPELFNWSAVACGMHVVVCGVLSAVLTNFRINITHFIHFFPCVVYSMNNLVLYELDVCAS